MVIEASASSAGVTDTTLSITTTGDNRALLVFVGGGNYDKPTTITFNSVGLTKVSENDQATRYSATWLLLNPSAGTYNITLNQNTGYRFSAVALSGVDTVTGSVNTDIGTGTTTPASVSNNPVQVDDVVFASLGLRSARVMSITSGTAIYDDASKHASGYIVATGTTGTVSWDTTTDVDWAATSVALRSIATSTFVPQIIMS